MAEREKYSGMLDESILSLFKRTLKFAGNSALLRFLISTAAYQKKASKRRAKWDERGIHVPPFMIASITRKCNLHCTGCYSRILDGGGDGEKEMTAHDFRRLFKESRELGISIILLAGGEPFTRPDVIEAAGDFPDIIFPVFTNGLLLDDRMLEGMKGKRSIIPVLSLEGGRQETDRRRGGGVHGAISGVMERLGDCKKLYGASITVTTSNLESVTDPVFIGELVDKKCKLFFFVEYIPVKEGTEHLEIGFSDRKRLLSAIEVLEKRYPALFIAFPGDEERFGGCLSAGRGFIHVNPSGNLEPCPFAPYSDRNLKEMSLKDALRSELLSTIRSNRERLSEVEGGCALWREQEWVRSLL